MKKIAGVILSLFIISANIFAGNFFSDRIFEIKIDTAVDLSNNVFSLNEILVKDLEIDLRKIASKMPPEGLIFSMNADPQISVNLNLRKFWLGVDYGFDAYGYLSTSKDLFDFLGYGNELNEELDISFDLNFDLYSYIDVNLGFQFSKVKLMVKPAMFTPVISMSGSLLDFYFLNDETGRLLININSETTMHTLFNTEDDIEFTDIIKMNNMGIDIAGSVEYQINYTKALRFDGRIPLVPGHIYNTVYEQTESVMDSTVAGALSMEMEENSSSAVMEDDDYYIHRPLKLDVYLISTPLESFVEWTIGLGFGIYHPFMASAKFYPEYYMGLDINLLKMLTMEVSTEYTDQIFRHQLGLDFSVRFVEVALGVSVQSASFTKSFAFTGMGAYFTLTAGL